MRGSCAGADGDPCVSVVHRGGDSGNAELRRVGDVPIHALAAWGVGDTIQGAQQAAIMNCEQAGGLAAECKVYGGWVQNAYSAIYMGANDSWSISEATSPSRANDLARHECQTVKAAGLTCVLKGSGSTDDSWMAQKLGWIDQPMPLPSQPSPTFVCVTGPGGSCLQPGAGVSQPDTWGSTPSGWLTSPVVGGCELDLITLAAGIGGLVVAPEYEALELLIAMGGAVLYDEATGNWIVRLTALMPFRDCAELATYIFKHKPVPQNLGFPQNANPPPNVELLAHDGSTQSLFQPVPESQLASMEKLPFLRQRFGYAVAQVGAAAALSQKYPAGWGAGTQKSVVCRPQQGGYRCAWSYQLNGAHHSGYVLVAVTANNYRLGKVAEAAQAAPASPASGLSPLWYMSIAAVVVIVAIVVAVLRRRRRATATAP